MADDRIEASRQAADRDALTEAQTSVDRARERVTAVEADLESVQAELVDHETEKMVGAAVTGIESDTGVKSGLTEALARRVAELGLQLSAAEIEHGKAQAEVENVRSRIKVIDDRMGEITRKRLEGNATDADVGELNALDYDKKSLQEALAGASQTAALLDPSGLRDQHSNVVADWGKHVSEAEGPGVGGPESRKGTGRRADQADRLRKRLGDSEYD